MVGGGSLSHEIIYQDLLSRSLFSRLISLDPTLQLYCISMNLLSSCGAAIMNPLDSVSQLAFRHQCNDLKAPLIQTRGWSRVRLPRSVPVLQSKLLSD